MVRPALVLLLELHYYRSFHLWVLLQPPALSFGIKQFQGIETAMKQELNTEAGQRKTVQPLIQSYGTLSIFMVM